MVPDFGIDAEAGLDAAGDRAAEPVDRGRGSPTGSQDAGTDRDDRLGPLVVDDAASDVALGRPGERLHRPVEATCVRS